MIWLRPSSHLVLHFSPLSSLPYGHGHLYVDLEAQQIRLLFPLPGCSFFSLLMTVSTTKSFLECPLLTKTSADHHIERWSPSFPILDLVTSENVICICSLLPTLPTKKKLQDGRDLVSLLNTVPGHVVPDAKQDLHKCWICKCLPQGRGKCGQFMAVLGFGSSSLSGSTNLALLFLRAPSQDGAKFLEGMPRIPTLGT